MQVRPRLHRLTFQGRDSTVMAPVDIEGTVAHRVEEVVKRSPGTRSRAFCAVLLVAGLVVAAELHLSPARAAWTLHMSGVPASSRFDTPYGLTLDAAGNVYVVDNNAYRVVKLSKTGRMLAR